MNKIPTINIGVTKTKPKSENPYKYKGWIEGKGTDVLESGLAGFIEETFPAKRGNCFSMTVESAYKAGSYRVLNFYIENLEYLIKCEIIKLPVKVLIIRSAKEHSRGLCVIHDTRIPNEWYSEQFCSSCSPIELLTPAQRLMKWRKIDSGALVCKKGMESERLQATTKKLKIKWSVDSKQDMKQKLSAASTMPDFVTLPSGVVIPSSASAAQVTKAYMDSVEKSPTMKEFEEEIKRRVGKPSDLRERYGVKKVNKKFYAKVKVKDLK